MNLTTARAVLKDLAADQRGFSIARWIWLRALGLAFVSVFASLALEIHALIGPHGITPAEKYFALLRERHGPFAFLRTPTLLWLRSDDAALSMLVGVGLLASIALVVNVFPRVATIVCAVTLLSFVRAAPAFAGAEPDGLLIEAAITSAFVAPRGARPGFGLNALPSGAAYGLLVLLWFRLQFECGIAKITAEDGAWRSLSALDNYYERQPFPTWIAWWSHQLPHAVHAVCVVFTLFVEVGLSTLAIFYKRARVMAFAGAAVLQLGILINGNYAALSYITLALGIVLLDDTVLGRLWRCDATETPQTKRHTLDVAFGAFVVLASLTNEFPRVARSALGIPGRMALAFGVGNHFALFDAMPKSHPVVELEISDDGMTFTPIRTRFGIGDVNVAPRTYAPFQPRLEWGLWYAALADNTPLIEATMRSLQQCDPTVRQLFRLGSNPRFVRAIIWDYRFATPNERSMTGVWWQREKRDHALRLE